MSEKLLLLGEEEDFLADLSEQIRARGMHVFRAVSLKEGLEMAAKDHFRIILISLTVPGNDGADELKMLKQIRPEPEIFLLSGHITVKKGVRAIKMGAADLLDKSEKPHILAEKIVKSRNRKILPLRKT
ncbi:MAG: response regulator [Desulfococcaceae bacterium]|jgi:DNA-binding NtrC family response regulator|nr:response regulator [Desulfococcaceae bacterium]